MHKKNGFEKERDFLERAKTIRSLWGVLFFLCIASIVPAFFLNRSGYFGIDAMFGFYSLLGLISCVALVLLAYLCGLVLKRREDYYQD